VAFPLHTHAGHTTHSVYLFTGFTKEDDVGTTPTDRKTQHVNNRAATLSAVDGHDWDTAVRIATAEYDAMTPEQRGETDDRHDKGKHSPKTSFTVSLRSYNDIDDDVPTWAWTHADKGRIPLGALTLFAGRPAAGKSTAARWFAAQVTRGTLPGEWHGTAHNVAYIAAEESLKFSVKPSLRAAGADMSRVLYPETITRSDDIDEARVNYIPTSAMSLFAIALREAGVKLVVVDPLMTMLGGGTDIYRNNEVRERVQPWVDLADQIGGVVIGITHLNKTVTGDVLAAINGSSAFGELCRAAFGFANDTEDEDAARVMSQVKNSLGVEDLSLSYALTAEMVTTASGKSAEMPRFTILGDSDRKVGEILRAASAPIDRDDDGDEVKEIVLDILTSNGGSAPAGDVLKATRAAGIADKTVKNKRKRFGVETKKTVDGWVWTIDQGPATSPVHTEVGTLGPSSSEGVFKDPEQSRSRGPEYTRERRDLATVTTLAAANTATDESILAALDTEYPMSPEVIAGSVPGLTKADAPARLEALAAAGKATADNRNRYTRKDPA
jgi:hypothetical protein